MSGTAGDFNNIGIGATALMAVLRHTRTLPPAKALLVMPLVMHGGTVRYFSDGRTTGREVAAVVTTRPELFVNFPARFMASLATSLNVIQFLENSRFINIERDIHLLHELKVENSFGARAQRIEAASANIASLLTSPADELYLNLRIPL